MLFKSFLFQSVDIGTHQRKHMFSYQESPIELYKNQRWRMCDRYTSIVTTLWQLRTR